MTKKQLEELAVMADIPTANNFLVEDSGDKPKRGIFVHLDERPIYFVYDGEYYELDGSRLVGGLLIRGVLTRWHGEQYG